MWRQVVAQSPGKDAPSAEILRYDVGWKALNTMLKAGRSLSGHERNCFFLNTEAGRFADISGAANIDFDDDGRVLAVVDWDHDGDLDFWIANRTGPQVRFLRNDQSTPNAFVDFHLTGTQCNRDAIGARIELLVDHPTHPKRIQTLRAGEGYLAQSSRWIHFGLGDTPKIKSVIVRWPDGSSETFDDIQTNRRYRIVQGQGNAQDASAKPRQLALIPSKVVVPPSTDQTRIVLIAPVPIPPIQFETSDGSMADVIGTNNRARIVNLWASWCAPCMEELHEWGVRADEFKSMGLDVIAINVDEPEADTSAQRNKIVQLTKRLKLPFETAFGNKDLVVQFDVLQRSILRRQRPLPVPTSFLIDGKGNLRIIYKGPVSAEQVLADSKLLDASAEEIVASSVPYAGKWLGQPAGTSPNNIAIRLVEGGFLKETEAYILQMEKRADVSPMYKRADANVLLGAIYVDQGRFQEAAQTFRRVLEIDPNHRQTHIELASVLTRLKDYAASAKHYREALKRRSNDPELRFKLGAALLLSGNAEESIVEFNAANEMRPSAVAYHNAGNAYLQLKETAKAVAQYRKAIDIDQGSISSLNNAAWLLATTKDDELRDGPAAVKYAELLCQAPKTRTPDHLDTLAAAYAASDRYEDAVATLNEAIRKAKGAGNIQQSRSLEERLSLYKTKQPYRE